jgi:hypothetical protein
MTVSGAARLALDDDFMVKIAKSVDESQPCDQPEQVLVRTFSKSVKLRSDA